MDYFKAPIYFIKKHPVKSLIIFCLDIIFYLLLTPIFNFSLDIFFSQISKLPIETMGAIMQSMEVEALRELQMKLLGIFSGIIGTVLSFFVLILLNIAIIKGIIWILTLKKKIDYKILLKSSFLMLIMAAIFAIFFILSIIPFVSLAKEYATTQALNASLVHYIPLIIVSFAAIYFFTVSQYFLIKEGSIKKSLKGCFTTGFSKIGGIILPFLGFFLTIVAVTKILANLGFLYVPLGTIIQFFFIISVSFFNRFYISKII